MAILIRDIAWLAALIGGTALVAGLLCGLLASRYDWPPDRLQKWTERFAIAAGGLWCVFSAWLLHQNPLGFLQRDWGTAAQILGLFAWLFLGPLLAPRIAKALAARETE